jgi:hypothetical protein
MQLVSIFLSHLIKYNEGLIVITHFYSGYVYVMYYFTIITYLMMHRDDPGETECPCLRTGCHKLLCNIVVCII